MNYELFSMINGLAGHSAFMDTLMVAFTKLSPYVYVLILVAIYVLGWMKKQMKWRAESVATVVLVILCAIGSFIIGSIYYESRPFVDHTVNLLTPHAADAGFPSDHSVGVMAIAMGIMYFRNKLGYLLFIVSFFVGFSRVYVGHHYPGDVLGAFILVWILTYFYNRYWRRSVVKLYSTIENKVFGRN